MRDSAASGLVILLTVPGMGALLGACEVVTHANDFNVDPTLTPVCSLCPASSQDLRHPPCAGSLDAEDNGNVYVYAWRKLHAGADASAWEAPSYDIGLDQDCSSRALDGLPVLCDALADWRGVIHAPSTWVALPRGIDSSLSTRVLSPLASFVGPTFDVDAVLSAGLEKGQYTELVVVEDWNGTSEDPVVYTRFVGSSGILATNGPPRWDGTDVWVPNGTLDSYPRFPSYVSGGVLVSDSRSIGQDDANITLSAAGQTFNFHPRLLVRLGAITETTLEVVSAGRWNLEDALNEVPVASSFLAAGDPGVENVLNLNLPGLMSAAADLPIDQGATPGLPCAAISFGFKAEAFRAGIGAPGAQHLP